MPTKNVKNCKYRNYLSNKNLWYFFKLEQRRTTKDKNHGNHQLFMNEEAKVFRKNIRNLIGEEVNALVVVLEEDIYGSVVVCNGKKEKFGYHIVLVEWIGVPWANQETTVYWNSIPIALFWYILFSNIIILCTHYFSQKGQKSIKVLPVQTLLWICNLSKRWRW